jgi:hypothetical protein
LGNFAPRKRKKKKQLKLTKVDWPIIDGLPMTKHFGESFSILLHLEQFKML